MSNEAPFQINLKTPGGTLLNVRAWSEAELDQYIDSLTTRIVNIVALEQTVTALGALSNAGLNPQPVAQQQHYGAVTVPAPNMVTTTPVNNFVQSTGVSPTCDHGLPMRMVPAGISKVGKPYKSFFACPNPRETACSAKG